MILWICECVFFRSFIYILFRWIRVLKYICFDIDGISITKKKQLTHTVRWHCGYIHIDLYSMKKFSAFHVSIEIKKCSRCFFSKSSSNFVIGSNVSYVGWSAHIHGINTTYRNWNSWFGSLFHTHCIDERAHGRGTHRPHNNHI